MRQVISILWMFLLRLKLFLSSSPEVRTISIQIDSLEICATETQTDPVKLLPGSPELYTVRVQTDAVKICAAEETVPSENLLTQLAHS